MKLIWKAQIKIPDGSHQGEIVRVEYRDQPFSYTDLVLKLNDVEGAEITYGCPSVLTPTSKLGTVMQLFGSKFEVGAETDPSILIGKKCTFMTINKKSKKNPAQEYAEVVSESLKPLVA